MPHNKEFYSSIGSSFQCSLFLYLTYPLFPVFHFLLLALFLGHCTLFHNSHPGFLPVCLFRSLTAVLSLLLLQVSKKLAGLKRHHPAKAAAQAAAAAAFDTRNYIYISKEADDIKRGPFTIYDILTTSSFTLSSLCISLCQSVSLVLHSQSFITNMETYPQYHHLILGWNNSLTFWE